MDREQLGLTETDGLRVEVADARVGLEQEPPEQRDLVVGDAFGGLSVPWQLTTVEAMGLVDRALTDDGVYVANLIDHPPLGFVRAELATLRAQYADFTVRPRMGTGLWLGDRGALSVSATVLDVHAVERGEVFGYRGRSAPKSGHLLVVSGGSAK